MSNGLSVRKEDEGCGSKDEGLWVKGMDQGCWKLVRYRPEGSRL